MTEKYYLDTCIWRDYFEGRSDNLRPLGDWAFSLIKRIIEDNEIILYSDVVIEELNVAFDSEKIREILSVVPKDNLNKVNLVKSQVREAIQLSKKVKIPVKDALHAILARDNKAVLITRDKHFYDLADKVEIKKPEDLI